DVAIEWEGDEPLDNKRSHVSDDLCRLVDAIALAAARDRRILSSTASPNSNDIAQFTRGDRRYICVHPGAGTKTRQWPGAHLASLIELLVSKHEVDVVLVGGADDVDVAAEILAKVGHKKAVRSLAGATKLANLPQLLAGSALFVGNNSGPSHLAA